MAAPSPSSALDLDNPEIDTREAFQGLTEAEREQHGGCWVLCVACFRAWLQSDQKRNPSNTSHR